MAQAIFAFDPAEGLHDWHLEGDGVARVTPEGTIHVESLPGGTNNPACTLWSPRPVPGDFRLTYDFRANDGPGWNILFFCALGVHGKDVLNWCRSATWDSYAYTRRMRLYTVSYSRGDTGTSGLRKIWAPEGDLPREQMDPLVNVSQDGCPEMGRWYRVELVKQGNRIRFLNNGVLVHDWTDDGRYGPPLHTGRIGLRSFCKWKKVEYAKVRAETLE